MSRWIIATLLTLVLLAGASADEEFILKDGKRYTGRIIIESPDRIVVKTGKGRVTILKAEIKERRQAESPKAQYLKRSAALKDDDIEGWRELAHWCQGRGLKDEEINCWERVLAKKADDPEARAAMAKVAKQAQAKAAKESEDDLARRRIKEDLEGTQVHFDFARATVPTILAAAGQASGVSIKIDKDAMKFLKKRNVKLRYKSDHSAFRALSDLTRHLKLDFLITKEGVVVGTRSSVNKLRKKLGVKRKKRRVLTPEEALAVLENSKHTLRCSDKPLAAVLTYLKQATPLPYVFDGPEKLLEQKVTFDCFQRPLKTILERSLKPLGLDYMLQGNVVYIAMAEKIAKIKNPPEDKKDQ